MKKIILYFIFSGVSLVSFSQISNDSLVAKYTFNGNTNDTSGNNRHANIVGSGLSLTTDRFGNPNSAYMFTAQDGSIRASIGQHTSELTVSLWYYSESQSTPYPHFFDYGDYKVRCHVMSGSIYNATDRYGILYETYNASGNTIRGSIKPQDSVWTHVVITFNKNTGKQKLYINGTLDKEMNIGTGSLALSDDIFCIGRVRSGMVSQTSMTYFNGKIDDIAIYSREITSTEVEDLFEETQSNVSSGEISAQNNIAVYPNPASGFLNFNITSSTIEGNLKYIITDISGKTIQTGTTELSANITDICEGVYFISFYDSRNSYITTERFIIQ